MCSTVFERKQVWGAHLSLLGGELNPILITTSNQSQHKTSDKSQIMTRTRELLQWKQGQPVLTDTAWVCRCAQMCRTLPLESHQGRPAVLPAPPHRQTLQIPLQDASHSFSTTTDIPPSPKHSLIWSKSLTGVLNLVFLCGRDNITRKCFICIRDDWAQRHSSSQPLQPTDLSRSLTVDFCNLTEIIMT